MLIFAWPAMLGVAAGVAALGIWALWRGERGVARVSSTRLWHGLLESAAGGKRRAVDPVWLLIFLGAVLAAVALAGPRWQSGGQLQNVKVEWAMRSVGDARPEVFVRVAEAGQTEQPLALEFSENRRVTLPVDQARRGMAIEIPGGGDPREVSLQLHGGKRVIAAAVFRKPEGAPFGLLTQTGRGLKIDPALWRVFAIRGGARADDASAPRRVLLVNDPHFELSGLGPETLVVVVGNGGGTLPGMTLGDWIKSPGDGKVERGNVPAFVNFDRMRIAEMQKATLDASWDVAAKVDGHPWLATRKSERGPWVVWIASEPAKDWAMDVSFPAYFSELMARVFPAAGGGAGINDWSREDVKKGVAGGSVREVGLTQWVGVVAIIALLGGSVLLVGRMKGWRS